jgi:mRNA interferase MazF
MVTRFDVYLVNLDTVPTRDAKNTRPCVIVSPNEMNAHLASVIIAPLSSTTTKYPTRIAVNFLNNERMIVLDQIRTVDRVRLVKKIGEIEKSAHKDTIDRLQEMFGE